MRREMRAVLEDVGHAYPGGNNLFRGLTVTLEPDRVYGLVGPSGSGKSTLLAVLAGWLRPTQGTVRLTGIATVKWVLQNPHGVPRRTALDHVALSFLARGASRKQAERRASEVLADFGIGALADRLYRDLSGGEAQRLGLARAIACDPELCLVDEPTAQLDQRSAAQVSRSLRVLADRGAIVVVATHDPGARAACTDVIDLMDYQT
ncbi:MAG: ATP-binding cassette domain-containing protein [Bifidobacteriaceae bacterium]|nr:ATP-binding cassette domain-containing protein [Bifidobacteriaceae bacterium]